jgi:hypothetical protein
MTLNLRAVGCVVFLLGLASVALAVSAHYVTGPDAALSGPNLVVSWKEGGMGNNVTAQYLASADGTAVYACINGGGNHPSATNKETRNGPVSATGSFSSGKNGNIIGSLTVEPPSAGAFTCPSGQDEIIAFVAYRNITLTDLTFNDTASATPSSISACLVSGKLATDLCPPQ